MLKKEMLILASVFGMLFSSVFINANDVVGRNFTLLEVDPTPQITRENQLNQRLHQVIDDSWYTKLLEVCAQDGYIYLADERYGVTCQCFTSLTLRRAKSDFGIQFLIVYEAFINHCPH